MSITTVFDRFQPKLHRACRTGGAVLFDGVGLGLIGIWWSGGVNYQGHLYFKHGADPRRAAILWAVLGYSCFKVLREGSWVLRTSREIGRLLSIRRSRWLAYLLACMGAIQLAIAQTDAMRVPLWDVGIFHQILWSLVHGLGFKSTISGAGEFLNDHFAPSLILLAPFFRLFGESPLFLPIVQVLLLFGGGAAWIYLAEQAQGPEWVGDFKWPESSESPRSSKPNSESNPSLAAATVVFILGFESLWRNQRWGFHENAIAFCSVSWAFALMFQSAEGVRRSRLKNGAIAVLLLVAAGSKEILLLDISIGFIVWFAIELPFFKKSPGRAFKFKLFSTTKIVLAIALIAGFVAFEKMAHPLGKNYFNRYYAYLGGNLSEFLRNVVLSPGLVVSAIGMKSLIRYLGVVLFPWLFLIPVFIGVNGNHFKGSRIREAPWLLMILPSFASAALASYPPLRDPGFHYVLELWPVLACVTIQGLARQKSSHLVWGWALMGLLALDFDPLGEYHEYKAQAGSRTATLQLIQDIPQDAAVMADELAGTWVSGRQWVTRWPDTHLLPGDCPDYVLIEDPGNESEPKRVKDVQGILTRCASQGDGGVQRAGGWALYRVH